MLILIFYPNLVKAELDNYPLILVHGHSVSTGEAKNFLIEYEQTGTFSRLENFQKAINEDGLYSNKGIILPSQSYLDVCKDSWDKKIMIRTTFYIDVNGGFSDNVPVEEYSRRLAKVVDIVKTCTNSSKVNMIGYSMGGLVVREYARNNYNNINKIITIGTPNQGIENLYTYSQRSLCSEFRYDDDFECKEMEFNSLFLNRLNENIPNIDYYTIEGVFKNKEYFGLTCQNYLGCNDGLVCMKLAQIPNTKNYVVYSESPVSSFKYLSTGIHGELIEPGTDSGSQVYSIVKNILQNQNITSNEKEWDEKCVSESKKNFRTDIQSFLDFLRGKLQVLLIKP